MSKKADGPLFNYVGDAGKTGSGPPPWSGLREGLRVTGPVAEAGRPLCLSMGDEGEVRGGASPPRSRKGRGEVSRIRMVRESNVLVSLEKREEVASEHHEKEGEIGFRLVHGRLVERGEKREGEEKALHSVKASLARKEGGERDVCVIVEEKKRRSAARHGGDGAGEEKMNDFFPFCGVPVGGKGGEKEKKGVRVCRVVVIEGKNLER